MGNTCASFKKSQKLSTERRTSSLDGSNRFPTTAEAGGEQQRRPSKRSADSLPYGNNSSPKGECKSSKQGLIGAETAPKELKKKNENGSGDGGGSAKSRSTATSHRTKEESSAAEVSEHSTSERLGVQPSEGSISNGAGVRSSAAGPASSPTPSNTQYLTCQSTGQEGESNGPSPSPEYLVDGELSFDALFTIKGDTGHMVAISTKGCQVSVWNIYQEKEVRTLKGISQPRDVQMINRYSALVLCNREIRVYNFEEGLLMTKLKGVMNQKMPFFGLHDQNYVVALSRNRMYVNMISVHTGNLETTFKVGEDRFLNSLLVSENGQICVCGDETQKPFPLLVWDLNSRKLMYDLRIPHHEFITSLSAISQDGHYVVCVSKELTSSSPNFIVVYDLQSGTLFKKWKPEHNTTSITIHGGFVINAVENFQICVWDLSTGNNKYTLTGHTALVDTLQVNDDGTMLLSTDSTATDATVRVWDLETGESIKVITPENPMSCCRLSSDGNAVVLCYKNSAKIDTVLLCHKESSVKAKEIEVALLYGAEDRTGMEFNLNKE